MRLIKINNQKGFTLVELLAVIVILGIIAAIAVPSIGGIMQNAKDDAHKANAEMAIEAARLAIAGGIYDKDDSLSKGADLTLDNLVTNGYLESVPVDPEGDGTATYNKGASKVKISNDGKNNYKFEVELYPDGSSSENYLD